MLAVLVLVLFLAVLTTADLLPSDAERRLGLVAPT
jgi:hypothetical protein